MRRGQSEPKVVATKGYSTTMALSTLKTMLAAQHLRRGDGIIATPDSRRKERLFGVHSKGRTKDSSTGIKLEKLRGDGYQPLQDTCLKAFVRLLKEAAEAQQTP